MSVQAGKGLRSVVHRVLWTWLALIVLLLSSLGSAYIPMGLFNGLANIGIAVIKVGLVLFLFMHVRRRSASAWVFLAVPLVLLLLMGALSFIDGMTRDNSAAAAHPPVQPAWPPVEQGAAAR